MEEALRRSQVCTPLVSRRSSLTMGVNGEEEGRERLWKESQEVWRQR
jgi:hypothetical protein